MKRFLQRLLMPVIIVGIFGVVLNTLILPNILEPNMKGDIILMTQGPNESIIRHRLSVNGCTELQARAYGNTLLPAMHSLYFAMIEAGEARLGSSMPRGMQMEFMGSLECRIRTEVTAKTGIKNAAGREAIFFHKDGIWQPKM